MKKYATLIGLVFLIGCTKSNQKTTSTTPPNTNSNTPAAVTALCGVWHLDSMRQFRANVSGYPLTDTLLGASQYYTVATSTLSFQSTTTSYTTGGQTISGYAYAAGNTGSPSQYYTSGITEVWNISGDTLYLPTTNHPNTCTEYWTVLSQTPHFLCITNRVWGAHCASGAQGPSYYEWDFQKWYYHK